jgi:hypothetical protein
MHALDVYAENHGRKSETKKFREKEFLPSKARRMLGACTMVCATNPLVAGVRRVTAVSRSTQFQAIFMGPLRICADVCYDRFESV